MALEFHQNKYNISSILNGALGSGCLDSGSGQIANDFETPRHLTLININIAILPRWLPNQQHSRSCPARTQGSGVSRTGVLGVLRSIRINVLGLINDAERPLAIVLCPLKLLHV